MPVTSAGCGEGADGPPRAHKSPPAAGFCDDGEDAGADNTLPVPTKAAALWAAAFLLCKKMESLGLFHGLGAVDEAHSAVHAVRQTGEAAVVAGDLHRGGQALR